MNAMARMTFSPMRRQFVDLVHTHRGPPRFAGFRLPTCQAFTFRGVSNVSNGQTKTSNLSGASSWCSRRHLGKTDDSQCKKSKLHEKEEKRESTSNFHSEVIPRLSGPVDLGKIRVLSSSLIKTLTCLFKHYFVAREHRNSGNNTLKKITASYCWFVFGISGDFFWLTRLLSIRNLVY